VAIEIIEALVRRLRFGVAAECGIEMPLADVGGLIPGRLQNLRQREFHVTQKDAAYHRKTDN
jgi:hypothetical protein